jgi:hypothetical protein
MEKYKSKPSGGYYLIPVLIFLIGSILACGTIYPKLFGAQKSLFEAFDLLGLERVIVPGSAEIELTQEGPHAIYYEYRSVVDGKPYSSSKGMPRVECTFDSLDGTAKILAVPDYVPTNRYSIGLDRRAGYLAMSFTVDEPGKYELTCSYPNGSSHPKIVLAIGQNILVEFFRTAYESVGPFMISSSILLGTVLLAAIFTLVIAILRWDDRRNRAFVC